jgi:hypothetical protein
MKQQYTLADLVEMMRDNARVSREQAYEQRHPGFARLSRTGKLRVMVQEALLEEVAPPPATLEAVVQNQREQGRR